MAAQRNGQANELFTIEDSPHYVVRLGSSSTVGQQATNGLIRLKSVQSSVAVVMEGRWAID